MMNRPTIDYYPAVRRKKSFLLFSKPGSEKCKFTPDKTLGEGTYGEVRLFTSGDKKMAVKQPKKEYQHHLDHDDVKEKRNEIQEEYGFMSKAYPHPFNSLHHFKYQEDDGNGIRYHHRMTQPFIEGMELKTFIRHKLDKITKIELAAIILNVANELQRLHDLGIIHGDIGSRNILITHHGARFIDFGMAYYKRGLAKTGYEPAAPDKPSDEMAPERIPDVRLKAHPSQDIYSLGKTLCKVFQLFNDDWLQEFHEEYPAIESFIEFSTRINAAERLALPPFIDELEQQIYQAIDPSNPLPQIELLLNYDHRRDSIAHIAARTGNLQVLIALLPHNPSFLSKNLYGEQPKDVSNEQIKPFVELLAYRETLLNKQQQREHRHQARLFDNTDPTLAQEIEAANTLVELITTGKSLANPDAFLSKMSEKSRLIPISQKLVEGGLIHMQESGSLYNTIANLFR